MIEPAAARAAAQIHGPDLKIHYWPIQRLIPYARNARTHSQAQVAEIAGSIRAFGFSNPDPGRREARMSLPVMAGWPRLANWD